MRYPLVDGQGNFGNIDGDNAAAMRYTEARMTEVGDAAARRHRPRTRSISARPTTRRTRSRWFCRGAFPNLLANGSSGIAVGMATSIPPHNAAELCDAALHLIDHPDAPVEALMSIQRARRRAGRRPGFPDRRHHRRRAATRILEAYKTGRGGFRVRARWATEDLRARRLPDRRHRDSLPGAEVAADREDRRAARSPASCRCSKTCATNRPRTSASCWCRRAAPSIRTLLMESLFKLTELESRFPLNMNVLSHGQRAARSWR